MKRWTFGVILVTPLIFLLLLLYGYPFYWDFETSLYKWNILFSLEKTFVGLWNYSYILGWHTYWSTLGNTLYFTFLSVVLQFVIGLFQALLLIRLSGKARAVLTALFLWPLVTASVNSALIWQWMYAPMYGIINYVIGRQIMWLANPSMAMLSIVIADSWHMAPWWMIVYLAAIMAIPTELLESIRIDGASGWQEFRYVTLPHLMPFIFVTVTIRTIDSFTKVFDIVYVLTAGGPGGATYVMPLLIFATALQGFRWGESATMSVLAIIISIFFLIAFLKVVKPRR